MHEYLFSILMSTQDVEYHYYTRGLTSVVVTSERGLRVQIPMRRLVPFITSNGIRGRFRLRTDEQHRFISLELLQSF
ncbi:MAG: DUF2835 family protein [Idiomarina sp.]|nr:DUF2835 family protein [Idiomarina sp.]